MKTITLFGMKFGVVVEKDTPPVERTVNIVKRVTAEYFVENDASGRRVKVVTTTQRFTGKNTQSTSFEYL